MRWVCLVPNELFLFWVYEHVYWKIRILNIHNSFISGICNKLGGELANVNIICGSLMLPNFEFDIKVCLKTILKSCAEVTEFNISDFIVLISPSVSKLLLIGK